MAASHPVCAPSAEGRSALEQTSRKRPPSGLLGGGVEVPLADKLVSLRAVINLCIFLSSFPGPKMPVLMVTMAMPRVSFSAVTTRERHEATACIEDAVQSAHGWIEDARFYSNVSLALTAVVPSGQLTALGENLVACNLRVDQDALGLLAATVDANAADAEVRCGLEVTFFHNEPDLRRTIPAVPG